MTYLPPDLNALGLDEPLHFEDKMKAKMNHLLEVLENLNIETNRILSDPSMREDERVNLIAIQDHERDKALREAKLILDTVNNYLLILCKAERWVLETKHPMLSTAVELLEAVSRAPHTKNQIRRLVEVKEHGKVTDLYSRAALEGDQVLAWLIQQHGLRALKNHPDEFGKLLVAISYFHPPDTLTAKLLEDAKKRINDLYNEFLDRFWVTHEISLSVQSDNLLVSE